MYLPQGWWWWWGPDLPFAGGDLICLGFEFSVAGGRRVVYLSDVSEIPPAVTPGPRAGPPFSSLITPGWSNDSTQDTASLGAFVVFFSGRPLIACIEVRWRHPSRCP